MPDHKENASRLVRDSKLLKRGARDEALIAIIQQGASSYAAAGEEVDLSGSRAREIYLGKRHGYKRAVSISISTKKLDSVIDSLE